MCHVHTHYFGIFTLLIVFEFFNFISNMFTLLNIQNMQFQFIYIIISYKIKEL